MMHSTRRLLLPLILCPLSLLAGCSGTPTTGQAAKRTVAARDDQLEAARQMLAAESLDRGACATALQQVNAYLATHDDHHPPPLGADEKVLLQKQFGIDPGELAEVENSTFTLLDAPHLEFCFLMRDAARSLDVDNLSQPERAAAAFAWVVRQVPAQEGESDLPPAFVVRRGWGNSLERARIYMALLQQMRIPGCLVTTAGGVPWACGALVEVQGSKQKQLVLFDHRLGLPLPGAKGQATSDLARAFRAAMPVPGPDDGQQVATLAALRQQPGLLKVLTTDGKQPYDVSPEQVKDSVLRLTVPLSALSPRMRTLQDDILPQRIGVYPGVNPGQLVRDLAAAGGVEGGPDAVRSLPGSAGVLRRFVGEREGGIDRTGLQERARLSLIPRNTMPRQLMELEGEPGLRILGHFAQPFIAFQLDANLPRDLVLRGRYKEAKDQLTQVLDLCRVQKDRLQSNPDVYGEFDRWKKELFEAYGAVGRAQEDVRKGAPQDVADSALARREQVWKNGLPMLSILVDGSAAEPRGAQASFQMALCMGEEAERTQAHVDRLARANRPADPDELATAREAAKTAWKDAAGWWGSYTQTYPGTPFTVQGQLLHARTRDYLGERDRARALLEDVPPGLNAPQKAGRLYMAQRLKGA
jgi:hypothetical protein